jgi:alpha-mannosidase
VPKRLDRKDNTRSAEMADLDIDSRISLRPGSDRLEVETTVDNNVEDHRLRVLLPSGAKTDTYLSDTPFDVVERKIALREDNHVYRELETEAKPQQGFTAVFDKSRGLAVVSTGLYETAIRDQAERTLALTLLRGVTRTPFTHGEPNGQVLGKHNFRYWIVPLTGEPDRAKLFAYAGQVAAGVRAAYIRKDDIKRHREFQAELDTAGSLLSVDSPLVLTSVRRVGEATEVRVFNPTNKPAKACIRATERVRSAGLVDLESRPQCENGVKMGKNSNIELTVAPKQIRTVSLLHG